MTTIQKMKKLCEAATDGPWETRFIYRVWDAARKDSTVMFGTTPKQEWKDAEFIAEARSFVPEAIAEIERLRDALKWYAHQAYNECTDPISKSGVTLFERDDQGKRAREALKESKI